MTKRLRQSHFWIWSFLGPLLILLFFASIKLRASPVYENEAMLDRLEAPSDPLSDPLNGPLEEAEPWE